MKHKETCIVLQQLKSQRILSISHTITSAGGVHVPAEQDFGDSRECMQTVTPAKVLPQRSQMSTILVQPTNTSLQTFATNVTIPQTALNTGETFLQSNFIPSPGVSTAEISQALAVHSENIIPPQFLQKPRIHNEDILSNYSSQPQQEIGTQMTTPVGHEYARQNLEEVDGKDKGWYF